MWNYSVEDELKHFGVLGMKWGVRRYQNKDGSLTSAGVKKQERDILKKNKKSGISGAKSSNTLPPSKKEKKQIKKVKNQLLNDVIEFEHYADKDVEKKQRLSYEDAMSDEIGKKASAYISERVKLLNDYSESNKDKLPSIVKKIEYSSENVSWDDLTPESIVTLKNGKQVKNWSTMGSQVSDNMFLDYLDYVEHSESSSYSIATKKSKQTAVSKISSSEKKKGLDVADDFLKTHKNRDMWDLQSEEEVALWKELFE